MTDIQVYTHDELGSIRVLDIDGEPWFVAKDLTTALGYSNSRDAISKRVDAEDKKSGVAIHDSMGRNQNVVTINESGMYSLILSSKLPSAKKFKRWVTSEVLPAIRKTGIYSVAGMLTPSDDPIVPMRTLTPDDYLDRKSVV